MASVVGPQHGNGGEWGTQIDAAFSRSLAAASSAHEHSAGAPSAWKAANKAVDQGASTSAKSEEHSDLEGEHMPPLRMPLDISAAPSLALPDNFQPGHPQADQNQQHTEAGEPSSQAPAEHLSCTQPGSRTASSRASTEDDMFHRLSLEDSQPHSQREGAPPLPPQQLLQPHADPPLENWHPQAARSPDPATQLAQWQHQQAAVQQQAAQLARSSGGSGGWNLPSPPYDGGRARHSIDNGDAARRVEMQQRHKLMLEDFGGAMPGPLEGYAPRQSVVSVRHPSDSGAVDINGRHISINSDPGVMAGSPGQVPNWMQHLPGGGMGHSEGARATLEQQVAAVAAAQGLSALGLGSGIAPRSTDVSPPRYGGAASAVPAGHYGEGARIYVGGVPDLVSVNMVRSHFSRWGTVEDVYFPKEKATRRRRPFCFVTFDSHQAAERAVAESNRVIEGYPVASITVPTERSTHYGLRPAPAGSSVGGGAPRGGDSVFVQARQAQVAQQAIAAQQQQAVVAQLAAAGVDPAMLSGLHTGSLASDHSASTVYGGAGRLSAGYPLAGGSMGGSGTESGGGSMGVARISDAGYSQGSGSGPNSARQSYAYGSSSDLRQFVPLDANGIPYNLARDIGSLSGHHLGGSVRATSIGAGEAARLAAQGAMAVPYHGPGAHRFSHIVPGGAYVPSQGPMRSISIGLGDSARLAAAQGHFGPEAMRAQIARAAGGRVLPSEYNFAQQQQQPQNMGNARDYQDADFQAPSFGSPHASGSDAAGLIAQMRAQNAAGNQGNDQYLSTSPGGQAGGFGGFAGMGTAPSPVRAEQWNHLQTASGGSTGGQHSIFGPHFGPDSMAAQDQQGHQMNAQLPGSYQEDTYGGGGQLQESSGRGQVQHRRMSDSNVADTFRHLHLNDPQMPGGDGSLPNSYHESQHGGLGSLQGSRQGSTASGGNLGRIQSFDGLNNARRPSPNPSGAALSPLSK